MAYRYELSSIADEDLERIEALIVRWRGKAALTRFYEQFDEKMSAICWSPGMYLLWCGPDNALEKKRYRSFNVDRYKVFYTVDESRELIDVLRVVHMSSDYTRHMF